jgi:hypothetical protein
MIHLNNKLISREMIKYCKAAIFGTIVTLFMTIISLILAVINPYPPNPLLYTIIFLDFCTGVPAGIIATTIVGTSRGLARKLATELTILGTIFFSVPWIIFVIIGSGSIPFALGLSIIFLLVYFCETFVTIIVIDKWRSFKDKPFISSIGEDLLNSKISNSTYHKSNTHTTPVWQMLHHDVFVSYAQKDKPIADAACAKLESENIRCWISPRDVPPGENFPRAIIDGIEGSKIMVLIFSSYSNNSQHVIREITAAVNKGLIIIPFRIEDIMPSKDMEYLISTPHWLDAITPPLEKHLDTLANTIKKILTGDKPESEEKIKSNLENNITEENLSKKLRNGIGKRELTFSEVFTILIVLSIIGFIILGIFIILR